MFQNPPISEMEVEKTRIKALRQLKILDSPFETTFDSITSLAAEICGMPISLISLIDENRQWFKSAVGLQDISETERSMAFCAYTIQANEILEVPDATQDDRFVDNPLVMGHPHIRFYAAAPITLPLGENIGTLCVIDTKPNYLAEYQRITLCGLSKVISNILVARRTNQIAYEKLSKLELF